ncbi:MAG TPA: formylglycine-generating enzyme family protein [Trueperaceae bacterium]|nr:formylglycine-generating enzyme family protein [Trueperaceae bacterium]
MVRLVCATLLTLFGTVFAQGSLNALASKTPSMVSVAAGEVELLFPIEGEAALRVDAFQIDSVPVTNAEFLAFVTEHPEWARAAVPKVFAGGSYLMSWASDFDLGDLDHDAPATNVSWFAAAAYCEARDARLPTEAEWEYVAKIGFEQLDGYAEPGYRERILSLTSTRASVPGPVGAGTPNVLGVHDLHGLVWEWVFDIGSGFNTADSRSEGDRRLQLVCGGGSSGASDKGDYAAFLRYAYRSGLTGDYTGSGLGFRCAS